MAAFLLLIFYVPRLRKVWDDLNEPLAAWQQALVKVGLAAQGFGFPLLVLLSAALFGAAAWRVACSIQLWSEKRRARSA